MRRLLVLSILAGVSIADLAAHQELTIGGDFEFFARPEWQALRERYGLDLAGQREFESTFMYQAVVDGEVDVISAFTTDGRIAANDLVLLADPAAAIPPYDAIVLLARDQANDARLRAALAPLLGAISLELMQEANNRVDRDAGKDTPAGAAQWLARAIAAHSH